MSQLGRISGPLLKDNLLRDGADLAFKNTNTSTDLLKLKVDTNRIGVFNGSPSFDLDVTGTTNIGGDLIATGTTATVGTVVFNSNGNITSTVGPVVIEPAAAGAYMEYQKVFSAQILIDDNKITNTTLNQDIEIRPNASGDVLVAADTNIYGNLYTSQDIILTGNIQINGIVTVGDSPLDTIAFEPDFTQSINPGSTGLYDLGANGFRWKETHIDNAFGFTQTTSTNLVVSTQTRITSNRISTDQSNENLVLDADNDNIVVESVRFNIDTISTPINQTLTVQHTGTGYLVFSGTNGFVVPVGTTAERTPYEQGATRWNTDLQRLECWSGTDWQVSTGGGATVQVADMEGFTTIWNLILG